MLVFAVFCVGCLNRSIDKRCRRRGKMDKKAKEQKKKKVIEELGGEPGAEPGGKAQKGQKIETIFSFDAEIEDTIASYNQFLLVCRENGDSTSVKLFESIIDEEQIHYNYFDNIHGHIENLGSSYLSNIAGTYSPVVFQQFQFTGG
jgi:bacterioferritin